MANAVSQTGHWSSRMAEYFPLALIVLLVFLFFFKLSFLFLFLIGACDDHKQPFCLSVQDTSVLYNNITLTNINQ